MQNWNIALRVQDGNSKMQIKCKKKHANQDWIKRTVKCCKIVKYFLQFKIKCIFEDIKKKYFFLWSKLKLPYHPVAQD